MRIDMPGLEAFLAIANWGSFRRAAGNLNLSQAALSHRLRKLETELGVQLLSRTTRRVMLTPEGLQLLPVAQRSVQELSATLDGVRERAKLHDERIAVGCLPTVAMLHVPTVLTAFRKERPRTIIQVFDSSAADIARRVAAGDADFGVTMVSVDSWDLEIMPAAKDPFVLVCSMNHRLAQRATIRWQDLDGEPLIRISAETGNRALIDEALAGRGAQMHWPYEVQRVSSAIELVRARLASTVLPRTGLQAADAADLVGVPVTSPPVTRTLGFVVRRGEQLSAGAALLMDLFRASLQDSREQPTAPDGTFSTGPA